MLSLYARLVGVAFFWGGTFITGRILAAELHPLHTALGRFLIAAALLVPILAKMEGLRKLTLIELRNTFLLGLTGIFLYNFFFLSALQHINAGRAALIVAFNPIIVTLGITLVLREPFAAKRWIGVIVALCGAVIVLSRGELTSLFAGGVGVGEAMMFTASLTWALYTIFGRGAMKTLSPLASTTYGVLWGTLLLIIASLVYGQPIPVQNISPQGWASLVFFGAFGTVCAFLWYYQGIRTIGPARTAVFNNLVPVFGLLQAALLLGEPILISMVIGGAIVITGVYLTNRAA